MSEKSFKFFDLSSLYSRQLLNTPVLGKNNFAITQLEDFRLDHELFEGSADKTNYLFFDTPTVANDLLYNHPKMGQFSCK